MANREYQVGDAVKVLSGAQQTAESGLDATIVRKMIDAEDYEVEYAEDQPGVSPFVHPDRMLLVTEAPAVETATETAEPAEATPEPAESATEA